MPKSPTSRKTTLSNLPEDMPKITMPFPPKMTAEDFLRSRPLSRAYFRSPNSFFIYRQQFVKQLKLENYNDQMVKVSKWAGIFWSNEPSNVKEHYKNIEKDIQKLLNEQFKNEQNNSYETIFIFEHPNSKDNDNENPPIEEDVARVSPDLSPPAWFDSPTMPIYDEIFDLPFVPSVSPVPSASPVSSTSPVPSISPLSPLFPSYPFNLFNVNENVGCDTFESYITTFDELNNFDNFAFSPDSTNFPWE